MPMGRYFCPPFSFLRRFLTPAFLSLRRRALRGPSPFHGFRQSLAASFGDDALPGCLDRRSFSYRRFLSRPFRRPSRLLREGSFVVGGYGYWRGAARRFAS